MTGHEMWMAGASEVVYSMLMMRHGFIAPNISFTEGDEATSKLNIPVRRGGHGVRLLPLELVRLRRHQLDPDR